MIFISGPLETGAETIEDIERNVQRAIDAADDVWDLGGWTPFVPHLSYFHEQRSRVARSWDTWVAWCVSVCKRCDALYRFDADRPSTGADRFEIPAMVAMGRPVYYSLADIPAGSLLR